MLLLIAAGVPAYILIFHHDLITRFQSYDEVVYYLRSYKGYSAIVFVLIQVLQIVISVLPGEVMEFAAGSLFGFPLGLLLTFIGCLIGTTIVFYLAKFLGADAVRRIAGENRMQEYIEKLNSEKAYILVFILYLLPGIPKDILCYIAGISSMRFKPFLLLSSVARIPGICGCLLFGTMYMQKNYTFMIGLAAATGIILVLCFLFRERLLGLADKIYEKLNRS